MPKNAVVVQVSRFILRFLCLPLLSWLSSQVLCSVGPLGLHIPGIGHLLAQSVQRLSCAGLSECVPRTWPRLAPASGAELGGNTSLAEKKSAALIEAQEDPGPKLAKAMKRVQWQDAVHRRLSHYPRSRSKQRSSQMAHRRHALHAR